MLTIIKEPLLHFAIAGSLLFALFSYLNPPTSSAEKIVVSQQKIQQLTTIFSKKWYRPANATELKELIDDYILEEVYYREALAMQMDKNDTVIRRRLRQKMEFLMIDVNQSINPSDAQLQTFLDRHRSDFEQDARYSFKQIYINPSQHADITTTIANITSQLSLGQTVTGDMTMLPKTFTDSSTKQVNTTLGETFVTELSKVSIEKWQGPIRSSYGLHWVYLQQYQVARQPKLKEVYAEVKREWHYALQQRTRTDINQKLLKKYPVQIDFPESAYNQSQPVSKQLAER
jgi:hypothetical protein